jgi:ACS family glucarate transporter-like MFS transporter
MLFFVSSINYADRATLSMAKTGSSTDLALNEKWMGWLMSAWGWSYVIAQLPAGCAGRDFLLFVCRGRNQTA